MGTGSSYKHHHKTQSLTGFLQRCQALHVKELLWKLSVNAAAKASCNFGARNVCV